MEQGFSFKNVLSNMTKQQKVMIALFVSLTIILLLILGGLLAGTQIGNPNENGEWADSSEGSGGDNGDSSAVVEEGINGSEINYDNTVSENASYVDVPVSTDYNKDHKYTLTEYMPSGIYDFVSYGNNQSGARIYWEISENTAVEKGIVVKLDSCDVEGNKKKANEYLRGMNVNLSEYVIVYQVRVGEVPCDA